MTANTKRGGRRKERDTTIHNETTTHPPPHTPLFITHTTTAQHKAVTMLRTPQYNPAHCKDSTPTALPRPQQTRRHTKRKREQGNTRRTGTMRGVPAPIQRQGHHATHRAPPFNRTTTQTEGGRQHTDGDTAHKTGRPATQPPFTHHATHHPLCHPPSTTAPPTTTTRGERTEDTPPHEHHTHTLTTHTARPDRQQCTTRTAVLASTAMG